MSPRNFARAYFARHHHYSYLRPQSLILKPFLSENSIEFNNAIIKYWHVLPSNLKWASISRSSSVVPTKRIQEERKIVLNFKVASLYRCPILPGNKSSLGGP